MRLRLCIYVLGMMLFFYTFSMLPSLIVGLIYGDGGINAFIISMLVILVIGFLMVSLKPKTDFNDIYPREGFFIVVFSWALCSLLGALPFIFDQTFYDPNDGPFWGTVQLVVSSIFESTSGLTTTGASVMSDFNQPHAIMFWRSSTHWLGGMGIIVLSLAILPLIGAGGMQLFKAEVPGPVKDRLKPRIADTAITLSKVYVVITVLQVIALYCCGMNMFDSICHTFGTVATGGFSTHPESVGGYNSHSINLVITIFMIIAGCNFAWHYRFAKSEWTAHIKNNEFKVYLSIIAISTIVLMIVIMVNGHYDQSDDAFVQSFFQTVSILTTTGFATADFEAWPPLSQMILFFLMFIGGCAASTAGGMKVIRIILLAKISHRELLRLINPTSVIVVKQDGNAITERIIWAISGFFILVAFLLIVSTCLLAAFGLDFVTSLSASVACLFNIGPGFGAVGAYDNYAGLPAFIKLWLSFLMIAGRLEVYSVLILFSPNFWNK